MKFSLQPVIVSALHIAVLVGSTSAEDFVVTMLSNGEELSRSRLSIEPDAATLRVGDEVESFDLKGTRWLDGRSGVWVTLAQCEAWAKQTVAITKQSVADAPANIRQFVSWTIEPSFEIQDRGAGTLTLTSGVVDYAIAGEQREEGLSNFFRYAKLNAYKKAMVERKVAPFAELKVIEELERRRLFPVVMSVEIPGVPSAPAFEIRTEAVAD
ncbi:hypothetical protein Pla123a_20620 [Posidoniimonas polymericola]|uniref:Uncharacterized protein n=1 Tax=Posidoniimonas polymericola TaxID=2528002 RepID=A0A5C5YR40_9BACT|nr:hypothetical protein [Posidoniimonas polymericola]TWT77401.1 hypothetical protein Pla123a_20620 [Posidoniimonas polymericola]